MNSVRFIRNTPGLKPLVDEKAAKLERTRYIDRRLVQVGRHRLGTPSPCLGSRANAAEKCRGWAVSLGVPRSACIVSGQLCHFNSLANRLVHSTHAQWLECAVFLPTARHHLSIHSLISRYLPLRPGQVVVASSSPLVGKTVRELQFRDQFSAVVVAISRQGERVQVGGAATSARVCSLFATCCLLRVCILVSLWVRQRCATPCLLGMQAGHVSAFIASGSPVGAVPSANCPSHESKCSTPVLRCAGQPG